MWLLLAGCVGGGVEQQKPAQEPSGPVESLGGVTLGAKFDRAGFVCEPGECSKRAEVAGLTGTLAVSTCGDLAHQLGFREEFLVPDSVADQLNKPGKASAMLWLGQLAAALEAVGFARRDLTPEETNLLPQLAGPPMSSALGRKFEPASFYAFKHPDGRTRMLEVIELPGSPEAVAIHPDASKLEVTISTTKTACTSGM